MTNGCFAVYRNVFALIVATDDYEGETYLQTKRATYKDIRTWVKKHYGLHSRRKVLFFICEFLPHPAERSVFQRF